MIETRLATEDDFREFFQDEPPETWTAIAGVKDGEVIGIGGVTYSDGVACAFLDTRERPSKTLHKAALRFFTVMREVGEPVIYTHCDEAIPHAAEWLTRLGFKLLPDCMDGKPLWRWQAVEGE